MVAEKHQGLPSGWQLGDNRSDIVKKNHVEHAVGLVKN